MEITKKLAEFIADTKYRDIPSAVVEKSKLCILDCLGSALGGLEDEASKIIVDYVNAYGGSAQATLLGSNIQTDVGHAALANGVIAHALDFDDYHGETVIHATASCLPALLAIAEHRGLNGSEILTALILGVDVCIRLGLGLGSYHYELGWHATATAGRFGATAGACKLLNLKKDQIVHAFGICGTQTGGVRQVFGTMSKPFNAGKACMDGVMSALLAEKGFTSSDRIIEGELGMFDVLTETPDGDGVLKDIGTKYHLEDISFKPYPTCA
jgi:2-methylcitrate dehydratase PrpD